MLHTHTTRDSDSCLIAQMTDVHLTRMIESVLSTMVDVKTLAEGATMDAYQAALYGLPKIDMEEAARTNRRAIEKLYPYLAEAYLRDLDAPVEKLREVLGRSKALPGGLPQISSGRVRSYNAIEIDLEEPPF